MSTQPLPVDRLERLTRCIVQHFVARRNWTGSQCTDVTQSLFKRLSQRRSCHLHLEDHPHVLCRIMDFLPLSGVITMSQTSSRMRRAALACKRLWTSISVGMSETPMLDAANRILQRSAPLPVKIVLMTLGIPDLELITLGLPRLRFLHLDVYFFEDYTSSDGARFWGRVLSELCNSAPNLEALTLYHELNYIWTETLCQNSGFQVPLRILDGLPGLKSCALWNLVLPTVCPPAFSTVTTLNYTPLSRVVTSQELYTILVGMPLLTNLGLVAAFKFVTSDNPPLRSHACLKRVIMRSLGENDLKGFLEYLGDLSIEHILLLCTYQGDRAVDILPYIRTPQHLRFDNYGLEITSPAVARRLTISFIRWNEPLGHLSFVSLITSLTISEISWFQISHWKLPLLETLNIWVATYTEWHNGVLTEYYEGFSTAEKIRAPRLHTVHFTSAARRKNAHRYSVEPSGNLCTMSLDTFGYILRSLEFDSPRLRQLSFSHIDFIDIDLAARICELYEFADVVDFLADDSSDASQFGQQYTVPMVARDIQFRSLTDHFLPNSDIPDGTYVLEYPSCRLGNNWDIISNDSLTRF